MANMTYCRFQNTEKDLLDCQEALENLNSGDGKPLSNDETRAAVKLIESCIAIAIMVAEEIGADSVDELAYRFGMHSELRQMLDRMNAAAARN